MTIPNPRRLQEVVTVFMMEGLNVPLARMRVSRCATWSCRMHCTWARWTGRRVSEHPWPVGVRRALVKLGPAFVKIGQILSVRSDLVPAALAEELHSLQADVPPLPGAEVLAAVERSLGQPLAEVFASIEEEPLAAGSVAQVHRAVLTDGTEVVVKCKRPGIDARVTEDLDILVWLAERLERHLPRARAYRPVAAARELRRYTLDELDFTKEAAVAREVGARFASWPRVRVPRIHAATRDVIIMEYIEGFAMDDVEALDAHGIDRDDLVRVGVEAVLAQIFQFGLFHADPHPGNLRVTPSGELVLLDFGIFGRLDKEMRRASTLLMWSLARGDQAMASRYLLRLATLEPDADVAAFRAAIEARYRAWHGSTVSEYGFARLLYDELSVGAHHGVIFPPDMVLLGKAMVTLEGVVMSISPEMDLSAEAQPFLDELRSELFGPERLREALYRSLPAWFELAEHLPLGLADLVDRTLTSEPVRPSPPAVAPKPALAGPTLVLAGALLSIASLPPVRSGWSLPGAALLLAGLVALALSATRRSAPGAP